MRKISNKVGFLEETLFGKKRSEKSENASLFGSRKKTSEKSSGKQTGPKTTEKKIKTAASEKKHKETYPRVDPIALLNEDQLSAATAGMGKNLVIASAGTGKTSTIMGRLSHLMQSGVRPSEILLLTFTSKAAKEMSERIELYFGKTASIELQTGTFHSTALKLVSKKYPDRTLKLPKDAKLLFKSVFGHRNIQAEESGIPFAASTVYEKYGIFINTTSGDVGFAEWMSEKHPDQAPYSEIYEHICEEFESTKAHEKFYDFNDILIIAKEHYRNARCPYREIIVDEYQDTNILQSSLLDTMDPESLYCVGDYDQSIYAFNGADITIIGSFAKKYNEAKIHTLRKNYRSSPKILLLAEKVIKVNERLFPKAIEAVIEDKYPAPKFERMESQDDEVSIITRRIKDEGNIGEIAVIYRSNSSGDAIEAHLREEEIPYQRKGGKSFFEAKDVVAIISVFKLLHGDSTLGCFLQAFDMSGQEPQYLHLYHTAFREFGHGDVIRGASAPDSSREAAAMPMRTENYQLGIGNYPKDKTRAHLMGKSIPTSVVRHPISAYCFIEKRHGEFLDTLIGFCTSKPFLDNPVATLDYIEKSALMKNMFSRYVAGFSRDGEGKIVEALFQDGMAKIYKKFKTLKNIAQKKNTTKKFIDEVSRKQDNEDNSEPAVQLLSVHASKGLEFETVHIMDLVEDVFPNIKLMNNGGGGIEEERRLFYVAVTRAKYNLYLLSPLKMGSKNAKVSRFIEEAGML